MVTGVLTRKLGRDLGGAKVALAGLALIQAVGIGSYAAFASCHRILDGARARYYREQRLADLTVDVKRAPRATLGPIRSLPNIREARGRIQLGILVEVATDPHPIPGRILSLPASRAPVLNDVRLHRGAWFSAPRAAEVLLNEQFAAAHGLGPGSRVRAVINDVQKELLVVGTAEDPEHVYILPPGGGLAPDPARYGLMYAPGEFLEEAAGMAGAYGQLVAAVHDPSPAAVEATLDAVERLLDSHGVTARTAMADAPSVQILRDELQQLRVNAILFPAIFLGIAALVMNLLLDRLVRQQRGVIGTLRAIGYGRAALVLHYCAFGAVVGLLGGLAGLALGWSMQAGMLGMYRRFFALPGIASRLPADIYLGALALATGAGVVGAVRSARASAALEPAEAMRPPPPERGGRVLLEAVPALWDPLAFRTKLALRTVLRNPFRSGVSVLAAFFGTSIMLGSLCMLDSFDFIMEHAFVRTAHHDRSLVLREPAAARAVGEVARFPGVAAAEGQLIVAADLRHGPFEERVAVTGLAPGQAMTSVLDPSGRALAIPRRGLLLSDKLARMLGVRAGDRVELRPLLGTRVTTPALVAGVAETFMGLGAWADRAYLSRLLGEEDVVNQVPVIAAPGAPGEPFLAAARARPRVIEVSERRRALEQVEKQITETQTASIAILVLLAGSIAFGSVLNTALVSIAERRREVATLRVIGYTPWQVGAIFSGESFLVNGVGIALGVGGGIGLVQAVSTAFDTELFRFPVVIVPARLLFAVGTMAFFVVAAQGIILFLVNRFDWLEALKVKE